MGKSCVGCCRQESARLPGVGREGQLDDSLFGVGLVRDGHGPDQDDPCNGVGVRRVDAERLPVRMVSGAEMMTGLGPWNKYGGLKISIRGLLSPPATSTFPLGNRSETEW